MQALVVREPWIEMILSGEKTWEMRSRPTVKRGRVALVRKGSGLVCGTVDLLGAEPKLRPEQLAATRDRHRIPEELFDDVARDGWLVPWALANVRRLKAPVPYRHPLGAVVWVSLEPEVVRQIELQ